MVGVISWRLARYLKIYRKSIENLLKIYRKSIENLLKIYRKSIENLWKIYWKSIEHLLKIYRKSIENLSKIYRTSIEDLSKIYGKSIENLWNGGLLWGHFWVTLGSLYGQIWVIRATLEAYVSHFDVEKPKMAHGRAICVGLVGPKAEMLKIVGFTITFWRVKGPRGF